MSRARVDTGGVSDGLLRLFLLSLCLSALGCFGGGREDSPRSSSTGKVSAPIPLGSEPALGLAEVVRISYQADQVAREAWWVLAKERRGSGRSPFGKVLRAATLQMDGRLSGKGLFECDRYKTETETGLRGLPRYRFREDCLRQGVSSEMAVWTFRDESRAEVEFKPNQLAEILGVGSSIFGKTIRCQLAWNDRRILETLTCSDWEQDRGERRIRLSVFEYRREGGSILKLKGDVLQGLEVVSRVESSVPLEGKIVVTEMLVKPPEEEKPATPTPPPAVPPPVPPPGREAAPPRSQPVDPDLMRRQFEPDQMESGEDEGEMEHEQGEMLEESAEDGYLAPTGEPDYIPEGDLQGPGGTHGQSENEQDQYQEQHQDQDPSQDGQPQEEPVQEHNNVRPTR